MITVDWSGVDLSTVGSYTVVYNVSDSSGNAAVPATRGVDVVDTSPPSITVLGSDPAIVEVGSSYTDAGATALDSADGDLTGSIVVDMSGVDVSSVGSYTVTYNVSDSSGNMASASRSVTVADTTPTGAQPDRFESA